ncbi:hypothetical protein GQ600_21198 [Phytophthora cactorum]|nr:hypothetical protein GQ600_21198 [Phytophthora cactorum]
MGTLNAATARGYADQVLAENAHRCTNASGEHVQKQERDFLEHDSLRNLRLQLCLRSPLAPAIGAYPRPWPLPGFGVEVQKTSLLSLSHCRKRCPTAESCRRRRQQQPRACDVGHRGGTSPHARVASRRTGKTPRGHQTEQWQLPRGDRRENSPVAAARGPESPVSRSESATCMQSRSASSSASTAPSSVDERYEYHNTRSSRGAPRSSKAEPRYNSRSESRSTHHSSSSRPVRDPITRSDLLIKCARTRVHASLEIVELSSSEEDEANNQHRRPPSAMKALTPVPVRRLPLSPIKGVHVVEA